MGYMGTTTRIHSFSLSASLAKAKTLVKVKELLPAGGGPASNKVRLNSNPKPLHPKP